MGHFITAKYWHCVEPGRLHLTISDTGWGKALWGKLYGQWLCEAAVFVYDFDRFHAEEILPLFKQYNIATFCAPPTMLRMLIKEDLSKYDLSSIHHATVAGEALNPEVFYQFQKATGLSLMEGFGQTETTLSIGNLVGMTPKVGSMGKPSPLFDVDIVDTQGNPVPDGEVGEIVIRLGEGKPACGLYLGYVGIEDHHEDGLYHTGDTAWRDEDGFFWYVGRLDDVIKSSGYRIGPFEIESVIMELPYVLECGVSAAPDPIRGQVVKASIVLVKGKEGTEELKKDPASWSSATSCPRPSAARFKGIFCNRYNNKRPCSDDRSRGVFQKASPGGEAVRRSLTDEVMLVFIQVSCFHPSKSPHPSCAKPLDLSDEVSSAQATFPSRGRLWGCPLNQ